MESRIENAHHRRVRHQFLASGNAVQVRRIVQRRQLYAFLQRCDDLLIDEHGVGKLLSRMNHAVSYRADLIHRRNHTVFFILNSIQYLLQSAAVCRALGGKRIIFHSGSCGKQSREAALEKALDTMRRAVEALDEAGFADMTLCPETMGKVGQLGTLDEVLALCGVDERITPCIDFGHLNARTLGGIQSKADYAAILDRMAEALGDERARRFHVHFSRIEYSKGGEKRHWTFAETQFGPEPQPLMELLAERGLAPVVICESAGTQAEDACTMQQMYRAARDLRKIL